MKRRKKYSRSLIASVLILFSLAAFGQNSRKDECAKTANLEIYSSAFTDEETGDLNGYELAIDERKDSTVSVFLYVYEGAPSEGIKLPGHISEDKLLVQGNWVERLVEYPSKKEIVQTHFVKISGTLTPTLFRGKLIIEGVEKDQVIELKRVKRIWMCK